MEKWQAVQRMSGQEEAEISAKVLQQIWFISHRQAAFALLVTGWEDTRPQDSDPPVQGAKSWPGDSVPELPGWPFTPG